ncbi:MAG: hypothetical protein HY782_14165 [Chloroflexi bacterium]|nr:hypothetical protein [Chloroflexota bacterium]
MVTLFLFVKGTATTEIENLVAQAQVAAALDTLDKLRAAPEIGEMVVATANADFAARAAALGARIEMDPLGDYFHFGRRLADLVSKYRAAIPLYVGGGSGALMSVADWQSLVEQIRAKPNSLITNNFYSCDFAAWSPGEALERIAPPELDNDLAFRLSRQAGLDVTALPKNAATQFDIDTPADLLTLAPAPAVGKHLRGYLETTRLDTTRVQEIKSLIENPAAPLLIAGRVSASMALFLERETRCQWRIFSEERGMRASGREQRGAVRSLLGFYLDRASPTELFSALAQLADGIILDSRVLFAHYRLRPSAADRFYSDLLEIEPIADPFVHAFTAAARQAPRPVLLGGHSLVSGGMYALAAPWRAG